MFKKIAVSVLLIFMLASAAIIPVGADDVGPVEPLTPPPTAETGEMTDETPHLWFVELSSAPSVEGTSLSTLKAEKDAFRNDAKNAGLHYSERMAFDTLWNGLAIEAGPSEVNKLNTIPGIKGIYPIDTIKMPETTPADPELFTSLAMIGADAAQSELGYTGKGIKVALMDTGLDYDHPAFGGDGVARSNSTVFPTARVIKGWDFVGDAFNADPTASTYNLTPSPDPYPDDCAGHGTHVAGIIGANDPTNGMKGVAPEVSFGVYRVFGCVGSTTSDIMLAAMERAYKDGMQVLNMSIGSAYQWPQYPTAVAASRLVKKGMVVVASIGNNASNGLYSAGAPGLGENVIGVASFDNTNIYLPYFTVNGSNIGYMTMTYSAPAPLSGSAEIVYVGRGCIGDTYLADPAGKTALIVRGVCSFAEKAVRAISAGATAVVIYNNTAGVVAGTLGSPIGSPVPVVGISQADGLFICAQAAPIIMTWTDQQDSFPSPTGGLISSFSSYGLSPDLALKPDIGAPGGNVYSSYPLELGSYATLSGTSMSSPHVAGAVALYLQAHPGMKASDVRSIFQNSAEPALWNLAPGYGFLDNVHRQGAGMLRIDHAIEATTRIEPGKLSLGESQAGPQTRKLFIRNSAAASVTYDLSFVNALSTGGVMAPSFYTSDADVSFSSNSVTVPAFGVAFVAATITPPSGPDQAQYGGYIVFTPQDGGQVYRVPYAGFVGDYQSIQALTPTPYGLPWLTKLTGCTKYVGLDCVVGGVYTNQPGGATYTLVDGDVPYILIHLEHQVQQLVVEIYDANTGKPVHPVFHNAIYEEYVGRNSTSTGFFALAWDGSRIHSKGYHGKGYDKNMTKPVPNGDYLLVVKVLKALGDEKNPADWETWTSPVVTIARP